jgi:hypothetical protein
MGEVDPKRRWNQDRLRAEVHAFLTAFTLAGTGIAIFRVYVGSDYVAGMAASISLLCFSCLLVSAGLKVRVLIVYVDVNIPWIGLLALIGQTCKVPYIVRDVLCQQSHLSSTGHAQPVNLFSRLVQVLSGP